MLTIGWILLFAALWPTMRLVQRRGIGRIVSAFQAVGLAMMGAAAIVPELRIGLLIGAVLLAASALTDLVSGLKKQRA